MTIKILMHLSIFLAATSAFAATGKLQNSDFATGAQLVSAGGSLSQLLNTSKVYDSTNLQLLDTTIASKITGPLTGEVTTIGSVATVSNSAVINKVLTGFSAGGSLPLASSDSLLTAFQKIGANIGNGLSFGVFGSSPNTSGASLSSGQITLQPADATSPGGVSIFAQTLAGDKTLTGVLNLNTVTASRFLRADGSKNVISSLINLADNTHDVTGLLGNANIANTSTTVNGVTCTLGSTCSIAATSSPLSIGTIDGQAKSANGLVTASNVLYAQTADATNPGMVSTSTQTFAGAKTLNGTLNLNTVTASRFLRADGSKNVTSSLINLANSTTDITGILPVGNGGTGSASTPANGQIPIGNGTSYVPANITAGTNVTITNTAGGITVSASGSGGGGSGFWTGYHDTDCGDSAWTQSPGSISDFADDASCTFVTQISNGLGTVTSYGAKKPGVTVTASSTGYIETCVSVDFINGGANNKIQFDLYDGTNSIATSESNGNLVYDSSHLCGVTAVTAGGTYNIRLRGWAPSTGSIRINGGDSGRLSWVLKYL